MKNSWGKCQGAWQISKTGVLLCYSQGFEWVILLLACRVGHQNLSRQDEFLELYGECGGSDDEADDLDTQGYDHSDPDDELIYAESFGPL